ncbi:hypothetical protein THASP1DRAFT_25956 [Thamnocephalis sphaerospora]|uniref:Uncharacterized protein n=1 Tax=Thamnocephalis sphaerospora TaxID=78915 RepID=A0A4P9XIN6_9FUNG|nr:hypothetical protein THASP1DRAFT_25956 [Thamnocephalis sphaerospora]|eukprot:RKP05566.1 hypothetical protein THASP1DRAFT_25956 [Thamnocephalis sphaerospora]
MPTDKLDETKSWRGLAMMMMTVTPRALVYAAAAILLPVFILLANALLLAAMALFLLQPSLSPSTAHQQDTVSTVDDGKAVGASSLHRRSSSITTMDRASAAAARWAACSLAVTALFAPVAHLVWTQPSAALATASAHRPLPTKTTTTTIATHTRRPVSAPAYTLTQDWQHDALLQELRVLADAVDELRHDEEETDNGEQQGAPLSEVGLKALPSNKATLTPEQRNDLDRAAAWPFVGIPHTAAAHCPRVIHGNTCHDDSDLLSAAAVTAAWRRKGMYVCRLEMNHQRHPKASLTAAAYGRPRPLRLAILRWAQVDA